MKSIKTKAKNKKASKFGTVKFPSKEAASIPPDLSQLYCPIDTSISTFYQASKLLENGSDEVRSLLAYECDLVYECRVCRSLFRSLINFISHKRAYCTEKFNITFARNLSHDYDAIFYKDLNVPKSEKVLEESCNNDRILRSQVSKEEQKKDLSSIVSMLQKKQIKNVNVDSKHILEAVQSNPFAVYQTIESTKNNIDHMKIQVTELENMMKKQTATLGPDGQVLKKNQEQDNNSVETSHNDDTMKVLSKKYVTCSICNIKFSTKKTLAVHMRTLHTSQRLCYRCPCCESTFANSWSVYRHLYRVHRKSNQQVRKLRSQIQEKAFHKDISVTENAEKERSIKPVEPAELCINETQEWMDHLESDAELQRCGGCGKRFDRKAALSSHSQYCQRRVAAYKTARKIKKTSKILDNTSTKKVIKEQADVQESPTSSEIDDVSETTIRVEAIASLSKADWDMLENGADIPLKSINQESEGNSQNSTRNNETKRLSPVSNLSDPPEIVYTNISKPKNTVRSKRKPNKSSIKQLSNTTTTTTNTTVDSISPEISTEKNTEDNRENYAFLMEKKMISIANLQKLQCLPCKRKFTSVTNLKRHVAIHIGWNRYRCKLCDFKCFVKCDCVAHCNKIHNAQNNRAIISDMVAIIPDEEYTCDQDVLDITSVEEDLRTPEIREESNTSEVQEESNASEAREESNASEVVEVTVSPEVVEFIVSSKVNEPKSPRTTEVPKTINGNVEVVQEEEQRTAVVQEIIHVNGENQEQMSCTEDESKDAASPLPKDVEVPAAGLDPDLRRMVMEVIFGSCDTNSTKQSESEEPHSPQDQNLTMQDNDVIAIQSDNSESKEGELICVQDTSKPQRPIRNRIKPLNKDFIYDLKEVALRKDSFMLKPFSKSLSKRNHTQEEYNSDKEACQASKKFKSLVNDRMHLLCENGVNNKFDIQLAEKGLKANLTSSQWQS